jgi:hypothetical protein
MAKHSFLTASLARHIHASGRSMDWWPYDNSDQVDDFLRAKGISFRGNGDHILVGLNHNRELVVQEIRDITDTADVSDEAFILSYRHISERVIHEASV